MAAYGITGVLGPYDGRLSNSGERITLSNAVGGVVLSFSYSDEPPWPVSPDGAGHSLVLARLGGDPDQASSWAASTYIGGTPGGPDESQAPPKDPTLVTVIDLGHPGRYFKGTREPSPGPGGQPTIAWTEVGFNDDPATTAWLEGPSGYGYSNDPAEMAYVRTELNDMRGGYMSIYARLRFTLTAEEIASFTQLRADVVYDDGFILYLNGVRVGDSGNLPGNPPPFSQAATTASDYPPLTVDLSDRKNLLVAGTNVLAVQAHNANLAASSDGFISVTLRGVVEQPDTGEDPRARVLVNEILTNSAADGDWIELYNPGPTAVDLGNVYLSNDRRNLLAYKIPDGVVLQPGGFWAVRQGTPPTGFPFDLDFRGGTVYVTAATRGASPSRSA
jgi:hypothetical protein